MNKCKKELEDIIDDLSKKYNVDATLSIRFGEEVFAAYGGKANGDKQVAFFGNTVSKCKKAISESFTKSKIIISEGVMQL